MSLPNRIYENVIIPLSYYLRGDLRFLYYTGYKKNLRKTKKEIEKYQLKRLKKLIRHSYNTVPYYRELFDKNRITPEDIKSIEDLKKIPVLDKETILSNLNNLKSIKKYKLVEYTSGGSTGNRIVVFKDKRYEQISRGIWLRDMYSVGIRPGDKCAWIWGASSENEKLAKKILYKFLWRINRRIILNAKHYTNAELKNWLLNDFNKFKPSFIYGYANSIYQIAKFINENNIKIHQVEKIVATSEKLEQREYIEKVFKCKVFDQYGSREILSIAIENDDKIMHSSDDFVIVEVSSDKKIILTPLESYGMPLIRYIIGDIGEKKQSTKNKKSHPFKEFNVSIGRLCEIFINRKKENVSMVPFMGTLSDAKIRVSEFQLVQNSINAVQVNMVNEKDNVEQKEMNRLKQLIKNYLGCSQINVKYYKKYPLEKSGKKIMFKCMIENENTTN